MSDELRFPVTMMRQVFEFPSWENLVQYPYDDHPGVPQWLIEKARKEAERRARLAANVS